MSVIEKVIELASPALERHGCDLVLASLRKERPGMVLRVMIEKRGSDPAVGSGVDHGLCAGISRELDQLLEDEEIISGPFVLEVSSPGIERPLVGAKDFARFEGRTANVKTIRPIEKRKRFKGVIGPLDGDILQLNLEDGEAARIPVDTITKANLVYEPNEPVAKPGAQ